MTYSDDYLVQKLREILLKLYPTPQTSPTIHENPKFPKLFLTLEEEPELNLFQSQEHLKPGENGKIEMGQFQDETILSQNKTLVSDWERLEENDAQFVGGVVHNVSTLDHLSDNSSLILGKVTNSSPKRDTTLHRDLHHFIQKLLKMSLSQSEGGGSGVWGDGGASGVRDINQDNVPVPGTARVELGPRDLEFNLTLDDIMDLNMLFDGSENVLQFKHVLIIFLYFLIAVVSIVGNLLVVQLVIRSRRLHTLTHALLANLAVADLLMATLNVPFSAARVILQEWKFGSVLCHLVPFVQVTAVYVTSGTMAVIAIDRYSVIMYPLGSRMKRSHGVFLVLAIWLVSGLLSLPYAIHHKVVQVLSMGVVTRCQAEFSNQSRRWLTVGTFLAQYLVPLLFTTVSYLSIMRRLSQRSDGLGSTTPRQVAAQSRAKKKTIKMLQITVLFFAASWAPINIYHLLTHFFLVRHNSTAILVCHLIAMSSCTVNPFIYCWFNDHFRREALKWMCCFRTRRCPLVAEVDVNGGMLTRADRCVRTQSTTFVSTSLRSPRLPGTPLHGGIGPLVGRSVQVPVFQSPSPTSSFRHSHIFTNGGRGGGDSQDGHISLASLSSLSPHSSKTCRFFEHPLSQRYGDRRRIQNSNPHLETEGEVSRVDIETKANKNRSESRFLMRNQSAEDIFGTTTMPKKESDLEKGDAKLVEDVVVARIDSIGRGDESDSDDDDDEGDENELRDYFDDSVLNFRRRDLEIGAEDKVQCLLRNEIEEQFEVDSETLSNSGGDDQKLQDEQ